MPLYNYQCTNEDCEHVEKGVFIRSVSTEKEERPSCIECDSEMNRLIGGSYSIHFGCGGFHRTDYQGKNTQ